jgi:hypothetical protein
MPSPQSGTLISTTDLPTASLADPWHVDGPTRATLHQLPKTSFAPYCPTYDPLDWPDSTDTSNDIHTHHPHIAIDPDLFDSFGPPSAIDTDSSPAESISLDRSTRSHCPPAWMQEYFVNTMALSSEPTCYDDAASDDLWCSAMNEEMDAIYYNGTWILIPLPHGKAAISTKWVFKAKTGIDGQVLCKKARLVARGFE